MPTRLTIGNEYYVETMVDQGIDKDPLFAKFTGTLMEIKEGMKKPYRFSTYRGRWAEGGSMYTNWVKYTYWVNRSDIKRKVDAR